MKDTLLLTKILLKSSFTKNKKSNIGTFFIYLLAYGILIFYMCFMNYEMVTQLKATNTESVFLNLTFLAITNLIIFQNVVTSINILFFSKDVEYILPLPISSKKFLVAKINCLLVSEYIISAIMLLPALIMYGVVLNYGIHYYFVAILVFFIFPILPVLLVVFVMSIILRFTKFIKNKDFAQYLSIIMTIIICFMVLFSDNMNEDFDVAKMNNEIQIANNLANSMSNYIITLKPAINTLYNYNNFDGVKNLVILCTETILGYVILTNVIQKFYIKIVINAVSSGGKVSKIKDTNKVFKQKSIGISYIKKEILVLCRNAVFLIQCVLPIIIFPMIILGPLMISISNGSEEGKELLKVFASDKNSFWLSIRLILIQTLIAFNFISITSISKDGKDAYVMKYLPLEPYKQVRYKLLTSVILNMIEIVSVIVFSLFIEKVIGFEYIIMLMIIGTLMNILTNYILVLIDLKKPKIDWTNEYTVVKQNFNMIFNFIVAGIICFTLIVSTAITNSIYEYFIILAIIITIIIALIDSATKRNNNKLLNKIEG